MISGGDDLLTLFPAIAEKRCIVADENNHGNTVAELRQDLLDEPCVDLMEARVNCGKRFVARRDILRLGELALCIWVRELHELITVLFRHCFA